MSPTIDLGRGCELQQIADLLYGAGTLMPGIDITHEDAVRIANKRFPHFEYCLVEDWIWVDLDLSPEQIVELARTQRQPALILAHTVIYDSSRRWDVGNFVRTSPLYRFEENFIFATLNSCYLLIGDGVRKRATLQTVSNIF